MEDFTFVIFGITSNLSQLKILPALYDLEVQNLIHPNTKIIGIGRKDIEINKYINEVLSMPNRHHQHPYNMEVITKLISRVEYFREDINHEDDILYKRLAGYNGNTLYYLATYPDLYKSIFESLKKYDLHKRGKGWARIVVEKPIGHDLLSSISLNSLLSGYFEEGNIFRIDHYLGKEDLQKVFDKNFSSKDVDHIQISVLENFSIGKRGIYYDATGALKDMAQNHLIQMLCSIAKESKTIEAREKIIESLVPEDSLVFGQYKGYRLEENVNPDSNTETFFALKTHLSDGNWKDIPIYMRSGKLMSENTEKISIVKKDGTILDFEITSDGIDKKYDAYEMLLMEAIKGNQFYFNSAGEVESAWKFIDSLLIQAPKPLIYNPGEDGPLKARKLIEKDGRSWV
jgi:glucose-6-phosphate 1-dehydrogenase